MTCPLCEAACGLEVSIRDGRAVRVRGDASDPLSKGFLCPKGASLIALHEDPDRLRMPLIRRSGELEPVSWPVALDLTRDLIERFLARGECEFMHEFAQVFPTTIFLRILGLPVRNDTTATAIAPASTLPMLRSPV